MTIGDRIRQRRIDLNLTQDELAKKVGYKSRSSIQKIESARDLPLNKVSAMAAALDCQPSALMGWEDTKPISPVDYIKKNNGEPPVKSTPSTLKNKIVPDYIAHGNDVSYLIELVNRLSADELKNLSSYLDSLYRLRSGINKDVTKNDSV